MAFSSRETSHVINHNPTTKKSKTNANKSQNKKIKQNRNYSIALDIKLANLCLTHHQRTQSDVTRSVPVNRQQKHPSFHVVIGFEAQHGRNGLRKQHVLV